MFLQQRLQGTGCGRSTGHNEPAAVAAQIRIPSNGRRHSIPHSSTNLGANLISALAGLKMNDLPHFQSILKVDDGQGRTAALFFVWSRKMARVPHLYRAGTAFFLPTPFRHWLNSWKSFADRFSNQWSVRIVGRDWPSSPVNLFLLLFFLFPPPQTCDGLVWPTSAPDTGESFPHFQWTCFQMLLASWTAHDKKISHLRPDRRLLNAPWKRTAGWRCSLPPSTWRTFRKQSSNVEVAQWWRDHTTTGWNITLQ